MSFGRGLITGYWFLHYSDNGGTYGMEWSHGLAFNPMYHHI